MEVLIVMPMLFLVLGVGFTRFLTFLFSILLPVAIFQHWIFAGVDATESSHVAPTFAALAHQPWWLMTAIVGVATVMAWLAEMTGSNSPLLTGFFGRGSK
ncbi:hypothetical protein [Burkholderia gladioli]|uniref:hypothetical protein n=1 Tax=Burkholderia gladioli TaxID=28095 RepID=UPI0034DB14C6